MVVSKAWCRREPGLLGAWPRPVALVARQPRRSAFTFIDFQTDPGSSGAKCPRGTLPSGFGGYPVPPTTFLCRWHEIRLTLHRARLILPVGVGGLWGVQRGR